MTPNFWTFGVDGGGFPPDWECRSSSDEFEVSVILALHWDSLSLEVWGDSDGAPGRVRG